MKGIDEEAGKQDLFDGLYDMKCLRLCVYNEAWRRLGVQ